MTNDLVTGLDQQMENQRHTGAGADKHAAWLDQPAAEHLTQTHPPHTPA